MTIEIELKYLVVNDQVIDKVTHFLNKQNYPFSTNEVDLVNAYFDTQNLAFRKNDFGLRVRTKNGQSEQTIKTAGQVIGGLHKRPEYNVDITDNKPNLSLFPNDIWPQGTDVTQWQNDLIVLFSTNFTRYTWLVNYQDSVIEMAFDRGNVSSSDQKISLCELELELISGNEQAIFSLAGELMAVLLMRPGTQSKAARGYQLWHKTSLDFHIDSFPFLPNVNESTANAMFSQGIAFTLSHLQKVVDAYFDKPSYQLLQELHDTLLLIRQGFWLFDKYLTPNLIIIRKKISQLITMFAWVNNAKNLHELINNKHKYQRKNEYSEQLNEKLALEKRIFPNTGQVLELLQSTRFNQLQLSLLQIAVDYDKSLQLTKDSNLSNIELASKALNAQFVELQSFFSQKTILTCEEYLTQKKVLIRHVLLNSWCCNLYDDNLSQDYQLSMIDILNGISELETLEMLKKQLEQLQGDNQNKAENISFTKLMVWLERKIDNLLLALNSSRQTLISIKPYW